MWLLTGVRLSARIESEGKMPDLLKYPDVQRTVHVGANVEKDAKSM
jgi:hypothetical protein